MWSTISLLFLSLTLAFSQTDISKFYCDLKWVAEGYGTSIPSNIISYTADLALPENDYIGRVFIKPNWIPGKVSIKTGKITIVNPANTETQEFSTYELLTNPNNCVLRWKDVVPQKDFPANPVPSEKLQGPAADVIYLGRFHVAGILNGGKVLEQEEFAYVTYEGRIYKKEEYQVLTSEFPKLSTKISNFIFPLLDYRVVDMKGNALLFGHSEIISIHDFKDENIGDIQADWTRSEEVSHNKRIKERIEISESIGFLWVQNVTLELDMWFGGDTLEMMIDLEKSDNSGILQVTRYRDVSNANSIQINPKTIKNQNTVYDVCSFVHVISDFPVEFKAMGEFEAEGMNADQIEHILRLEGRKGIKRVGNSKSKLRAEIEGYLDGRYVYKTSSKSRIGNTGVSCSI